MGQRVSTLTTAEYSPTQHAMLIVWGHFARTIGLLEQLAQVPIAQKTVVRAPYEKVTAFLVGLLAGIEYLSDVSAGAAPIACDGEVAQAWQLQPLADASGISRTLQASDKRTVQALSATLDAVGQPFLDRAVRDLRQQAEALLLDADLTGRPVSSTSTTFPGAAFGYMDGEVRLGYQLAEICLQTHLYGRQWLSAQHHPGDTVSVDCLHDLLRAAEHRLGCHPRRRPELVQQRIAASEQTLVALEAQLAQIDPRLAEHESRIGRLTTQIRDGAQRLQELEAAPRTPRQDGPYSARNQLRKQVAGWQGQLVRAQAQLTHLRTVDDRWRQRQQAQLAAQRTECQRLHADYAQLCRDNAQLPNPPHCKLRLDAGFASGANLSLARELGYDLDIKSANPAVIQALRQRVPADAGWTRVGQNAEMLGWTDYYLTTCPYPLTVGLERFHTPKGVLYAVLLRNQPTTPAALPDLAQWFHDYNGRQTIEAGNKEEKTTFKIQHLMTRSAAGIGIQALLTVFAANFVRWAEAWIRPRIAHSTRRFDTTLTSPKRLVRIAANSPATIDRSTGQQLVRFCPLSSFNGGVICLSGLPEPPSDPATNAHFLSG